jgi:hypothetical protein
MARPYSLHLRNPTIKAHQEGKFSIRQIAQCFQGCPPRARNWSESESLHHLSTTRKAEAKPEKNSPSLEHQLKNYGNPSP